MKVNILGTEAVYDLEIGDVAPEVGDVQFTVTGLMFVRIAEDNETADAILVGMNSMGIKTSGLFDSLGETVEKEGE